MVLLVKQSQHRQTGWDMTCYTPVNNLLRKSHDVERPENETTLVYDNCLRPKHSLLQFNQ